PGPAAVPQRRGGHRGLGPGPAGDPGRPGRRARPGRDRRRDRGSAGPGGGLRGGQPGAGPGRGAGLPLRRPDPRPSREHVMPILSYLRALNRALGDEMERDPTVCVFGEDIGVAVSNVTTGLLKRYGPDRVIDMPISEQALTSLATG